MVGRQRQRVVPQAAGRVLEVGVGTGLNRRYDDKTRVSQITALELHPLAALHEMRRVLAPGGQLL